MGLSDGSGVPAWVNETDALTILQWLVQRTGAASIIDIGTGLGHLVKAAEEAGVTCLGVEGNAELALSKVCNAPLYVEDATSDWFWPGRFDLATSFECVEHVPMESQERFFAGVKRASSRLICSIHTEGEENEAHMTIRPVEWWVEWLVERGADPMIVTDFPIKRFNDWGSAILDIDLTGYSV